MTAWQAYCAAILRERLQSLARRAVANDNELTREFRR